jgi:rod shape determining protein RodA
MPRPNFRIVQYRIGPGIDWLLILSTLALAAFGILTLWGARSGGQGLGAMDGIVRRQCLWVGFGLGSMVVLTLFDYRRLKPLAWLVYGIFIAALVGLLYQGLKVKGAQSWFDLGLFRLQPSEPGKIIVVLALARYLAPRAKSFRGLRQTWVPMLIAGLPMGLIAMQPDLGTASVVIPITAAMFWVAGLRKRVFVLFLVVGLALAATAYPLLKPYQRQRINTFLQPHADPRGKGYNIIQAQASLGSGQMLGKGLGRATQTAYRFLPEYHTDFIFPTLGEQMGMVGCGVALALFVLLIGRMAHLAAKTHDRFGVLIITGLAAILTTHILFNIAMTVGLMPVTGVPLPFFSYGGSFMLTCMASVGLVIGIGARRGL